MSLKWLLFSSRGNLNRKNFWITILVLYSIPFLLTVTGDEIFENIGKSEISFLMFFISKMFPRLFWLFVLACSYYVARKRVNEIQSSIFIPILYIVSILLPTFLQTAKLDNLALIFGIIPTGITFYLGLAPPKKINLS
ncbi:MAG TPA: hypothetical protein EYO89_01280 [Candidatus Dadabacteria bacterium]|nr:hypothetical protein [Candidatus Dadabacteria bacterium]